MGNDVLAALEALSEEELADLPGPFLRALTSQVEAATCCLLSSPARASPNGCLMVGGRAYSHLKVTSGAIVGMIEEDDCDLLVVDQPVRHGKTELCSRWTPAWYLSRFPERRVLLASYEADFAATHGRRVRRAGH